MWNTEHFSDIDSLSFFAGLGGGRVIASIGSLSLKLLLWLNRYLLYEAVQAIYESMNFLARTETKAFVDEYKVDRDTKHGVLFKGIC